MHTQTHASHYILPTTITPLQNEIALSYHSVRAIFSGCYFWDDSSKDPSFTEPIFPGILQKAGVS